MRGRFCYLAERRFGPTEFSRVVETLKRVGITLANPLHGAISQLTDEGDQVESSQTQLANSVEASSPITFQVWFSEDTDLVCSLYPLSDGVFVHKYNIDGLAPEERTVVENWAINYFTERSAVDAALLLVVDSEAATAEFDWDGFVEGRCGAPSLPPEILGLCSPLQVGCGGSVVQINNCRLIMNRVSKGG